MRYLRLLVVACCLLPGRETLGADPPYWGTIFIDPDIVTPEDPTTFSSLEYAGRGSRQMYDRREGWVTLNAYLFDVQFSDGLSAEIQVNPEFQNRSAAEIEAERFAPAIGQLPTVLRSDMETVWIHKGDNAFGGGNNNILIHTGQADDYIRDGILEETLIHEAAHTSLDADHARAAGWLEAQDSDPTFISTYARDNPFREDIAESFLPYIAAQHRADRISEEMLTTIRETIPNRLKYFETQDFDLFPIVEPTSPCMVPIDGLVGDLDANGEVGFSDFLILSANFGGEGVGYSEGDIDCSGTVDFPDFLVLSANFGKSVALAQSVPEPSGFHLGVFLMVAVQAVVKRRA